MPARPPLHRFRRSLMLSLTVLTVLLSLLAPATTSARAHKASCHVSTTAHLKHGAGRCPPPARKAKRRHVHHHSNSRPHAKHRVGTHPLAGSGEAEGESEAVCEDGSAPSPTQEGSFLCDDGSTPECEAGAVAAPSGDGSTLLCEAPESEEQES